MEHLSLNEQLNRSQRNVQFASSHFKVGNPLSPYQVLIFRSVSRRNAVLHINQNLYEDHFVIFSINKILQSKLNLVAADVLINDYISVSSKLSLVSLNAESTVRSHNFSIGCFFFDFCAEIQHFCFHHSTTDCLTLKLFFLFSQIFQSFCQVGVLINLKLEIANIELSINVINEQKTAMQQTTFICYSVK